VQNVNELHERIIRAAQYITNVMIANTWQAHKKLCEVQHLNM